MRRGRRVRRRCLRGKALIQVRIPHAGVPSVPPRVRGRGERVRDRCRRRRGRLGVGVGGRWQRRGPHHRVVNVWIRQRVERPIRRDRTERRVRRGARAVRVGWVRQHRGVLPGKAAAIAEDEARAAVPQPQELSERRLHAVTDRARREGVGRHHTHIGHRVGSRRGTIGVGRGDHQRWYQRGSRRRGRQRQRRWRPSRNPRSSRERRRDGQRQLRKVHELLVEGPVLLAEDAEEDLLIHDQVEVDQARLGVLAQPVEVRALGHRADGADHLAGHLEELEYLEPAVRSIAAHDAAWVGRGCRCRCNRPAVPAVEELVHQVGESVGGDRVGRARDREVVSRRARGDGVGPGQVGRGQVCRHRRIEVRRDVRGRRRELGELLGEQPRRAAGHQG